MQPKAVYPTAFTNGVGWCSKETTTRPAIATIGRTMVVRMLCTARRLKPPGWFRKAVRNTGRKPALRVSLAGGLRT